MKIVVGKKYRVKTVEQMLADFPVDGVGAIHTPAAFLESMRQYCGSIVTITGYSDPFYNVDIDKGRYFWDADMLLPLEGTIEYYLLAMENEKRVEKDGTCSLDDQ